MNAAVGDPDEAQRLFAAAVAMLPRAHAPYSDFPVGAAVLTAEGAVHAGCNVENASFPEGWCAETTALAHLVAAGGGHVVAVAVVAPKLPKITPCGGCRQRLAEFGGPETRVHLCAMDGPLETVRLGDLLPRAFDGDAVGER